jgi:Fe-S cluster assembly scaffold protein SufB
LAIFPRFQVLSKGSRAKNKTPSYVFISEDEDSDTIATVNHGMHETRNQQAGKT